GSELECVHAHHTADIHFAGARQQLVTHHTHDGAGNHAEVFFESRPALYGTHDNFGLSHPMVDHRAEFGHLQQRFLGNALGRDITFDGRQFLLCDVVAVLHAMDAAEDLGEVYGFNRNAMALQDFFAVAHRVESRRPRPQSAYADLAQTSHHPAYAREPFQ